jgi:hypothetical protein
MSNFELLKQLVKRIKKFSWLIGIIAILFAGIFYYIAKQSIGLYTSKATVFPLNSSSDNNITSSAISSILGLSDAPKSFSAEAAINIVELATSRRTREAVANTRIPEMKNKTITQLLIEENNSRTGFMKNEKIDTRIDTANLVNIASNMLFQTFTSKINKNGILELYYTNSNQAIVRAVSYVFIDKISEFYVELKKKKAQIDFEFAVRKADSLKFILDALDRKMILQDETTYFTNNELKRYSIPKVNIINDKQTIQSQYYYAVNNREAAAYRLQKETPVIETLDKPEGPYIFVKKSSFVYALVGLIIGAFIGLIAVSWKIMSDYLNVELNKAIEKASKPKAPPAVAE